MIFFVILLLLACILLGLIILIQNPKGGGLSGNVAGFSNQFMGVKQTNTVLEKGTWILAVAVALLLHFLGIGRAQGWPVEDPRRQGGADIDLRTGKQYTPAARI